MRWAVYYPLANRAGYGVLFFDTESEARKSCDRLQKSHPENQFHVAREDALRRVLE